MSQVREMLLHIAADEDLSRNQQHPWLLRLDGLDVGYWKNWKKFYRERMDGWSHIFIVREPLERLWSGYLDRCVGGKGCYEEMWNKTSSGFSHFLDHLEQDNLHQTDEHFRLQSADCGSHMFEASNIIKFSNSGNGTSLHDIMTKICYGHNISEACNKYFPARSNAGHRTNSARTLSIIRESPGGNNVEARVRSLYMKDYELMGII
jgi:hypothetical protein